jgi:hypothetical protein
MLACVPKTRLNDIRLINIVHKRLDRSSIGARVGKDEHIVRSAQGDNGNVPDSDRTVLPDAAKNFSIVNFPTAFSESKSFCDLFEASPV